VKRLKRHWLAAVTGLVLLAAIAWIGWGIYLRLTLKPTPRNEYWISRINEIAPRPASPVSHAEAVNILSSQTWNNQPPAPAQEGYVRQSYGNLRSDADSGDPDGIEAFGNFVFVQDEFIAARNKVIALAARGWDRSIEWPLGWHVASIWRHWDSLLFRHGRWAHQIKGDTSTCLENWQAALQLGHCLEQSASWPENSSAYLSRALLGRNIAKDAPVVAMSIATNKVIPRLRHAAGPVLSTSQLRQWLQLEANAVLENLYVSSGGDWINVTAKIEAMSTTPPNSALVNLATPLYYDLNTARKRVDAMFDDVERFETPAAYLRYTLLPDVRTRITCDSVLMGMEQSMAPPLFLHYYIGWIKLEASWTTLAIHKFHSETQHWPETLEALVPKYLDKLPHDYLNNEPLRYKLTEDGFLMYSIGINGKDDGGSELELLTNHEARFVGSPAATADIVLYQWPEEEY
jgi:hypothetical protein